MRLIAAAALGFAAALLVSCGSSGTGLIPSAQAGPLRSDFAAVDQAATSGNGSCAATETAIARTEQDFAALPAGVDAGLRNNLRQGIANLRSRALVICAQTTGGTTTTATSTAKTTPTTTTDTTPTVTETTPTTPTVTETTPTQTTPTTTGAGGGTVAPGQGEAPPGDKGGGGGTGGAGQENGK
jgi:hypothetical protein